MLAIVAPGQGAQAAGMLTGWAGDPRTADFLAAAGAAAGLDLLGLGTTADAAALTDTAVAQPLLVAAGIAAGLALPAPRADVIFAGHSLGELTAAALAGALEPLDAVRLAAARGRAMAGAAALEPTGMSALLGAADVDLDPLLARHGLQVANRNGRSQLVVAGRLDDLDRLSGDLPPGVRARPLAVAGAFHTRFMAPAGQEFAEHAAAVAFRDPERPLVSNADGAVVTDGAELRRRLVDQLTRPVRFDLVLATLRALRVQSVVELLPGGTLVAIARRELDGVATHAIRTPADLAVPELAASQPVAP